MKSIWYFET